MDSFQKDMQTTPPSGTAWLVESPMAQLYCSSLFLRLGGAAMQLILVESQLAENCPNGAPAAVSLSPEPEEEEETSPVF